MHGAAKDSTNPHFGNRYADLASIVDAIREELAKNEIAWAQNPSTPEAGIAQMTTMLIHSSGEWLESDALRVQAKDGGPQAMGSCITYLRRYQLAAMVGIAPDDDAEAAEGRPPVQSSGPAVVSRPAPPQRPALASAAGNRTVTRTPPPPEDAPPLTDADIPFDRAAGGKR